MITSWWVWLVGVSISNWGDYLSGIARSSSTYTQHARTHTHTHARTRMHTYTHSHTHTYTPHTRAQPPTIVSNISDETVIAENVVQLHCQIEEGATPTPSVEWTHNWKPLNIDRAFTSFGGESCVLRIKSVQASDEGTYTCTIWNEHGVASSTARLTVLSKL